MKQLIVFLITLVSFSCNSNSFYGKYKLKTNGVAIFKTIEIVDDKTVIVENLIDGGVERGSYLKKDSAIVILGINALLTINPDGTLSQKEEGYNEIIYEK